MKKNIFSLLLVLLYPFFLFSAADTSEIITDENKRNILTINFSENPTLCFEKERFLNYFQRNFFSAEKLNFLRESLKETFKVIILYETKKDLDPLSLNLPYLQELMPELKAVITLSPTNKQDIELIQEIQFDNTHEKHAYADENLNLFLFQKTGITLKQLIQKWPQPKKYNETCFILFAPLYFKACKEREQKGVINKRKKQRKMNNFNADEL